MWPAVSVPCRLPARALYPSQTNTPEIHSQAGQGMIPNIKKVARGARQAKNDRTPYKAPDAQRADGLVSDLFRRVGATRRTTGSEGRVSWVFLHAGVPPKAGH